MPKSASVGFAFAVTLAVVSMPTEARAQNREPARRVALSQALSDCPGCPQLVTVPAGEFLMGSPDSEKGRDKAEGPQRKVVIQRPFAVGKYEVTFAEWDACSSQGGCQLKPSDEGWGRGKQPVVNVSWSDANQYVAWLTKRTGKAYRLLTEAEWEYAARGETKVTDTSAPFSTGPSVNYKQANYDANFIYGPGKIGVYRQKTVAAGSLPANAFGLHEMHGNVWEWVQDCYKPDYKDAPGDGSAVTAGDCKLRVLRGGAWNYYPWMLRSAYRHATAGEVRLNNTGFRVARDL